MEKLKIKDILGEWVEVTEENYTTVEKEKLASLNTIVVSATEPTEPYEGMLWLDTSGA